MTEMLNIALPKGRLGVKVYGMFAQAGYECPEVLEESRKLFFENADKGVRYFWVKPSDVTVYVERGACDIGVAGRDIILENEPEVYELCDLRTGVCRMSVSALKDFKDDPTRTLKVATKFPNIATKYYSGFGRDVDIIKLNGSIEIAPIVGLSDVIVDIVETGNTLRENNMHEIRLVENLSARLIANKANYEFRRTQIEKLRNALESVIA